MKKYSIQKKISLFNSIKLNMCSIRWFFTFDNIFSVNNLFVQWNSASFNGTYLFNEIFSFNGIFLFNENFSFNDLTAFFLTRGYSCQNTVCPMVLSRVVLKTMNEKDEFRKLPECLVNASRHLSNLLSNEGSSSQSKAAGNDLHRSRVSTAVSLN